MIEELNMAKLSKLKADMSKFDEAKEDEKLLSDYKKTMSVENTLADKFSRFLASDQYASQMKAKMAKIMI